ncbi:Ribosomal protein L11 methyltransferase [hydrothermal vent metagenome]|uniref:Ribosomal protein L11 methyltransferase n=1 Tax=hydrothermal vent metagenome TaxID=652676 RepID=A0A3B0ZBD1_9ZZZZ
MPWTEIRFTTNRQHADELSDFLHESGAVAVTFQEGGNQQIFEPAPGETPLWDETHILGLFEQDQNIDAVISNLKTRFTESKFPTYELAQIQDQDWERAWLTDFKPMKFGEKLWIIPSEFSPEDDEAVNIYLDPGLAFGTGTHATTSLCLSWLDANRPEGKKTIDYGCGSGILAIAAVKLGASDVSAVDIDPQAIDATQVNAEKNRVENSIKCYLAETFKTQSADLLLANILASTLVDLAENFHAQLRPGGQIVVSGILNEQTQDVLTEYKKWFEMNKPETLDGWVLLSGWKPS